MNAEKTIGLSEIHRRFGVPKHEIIYLCEKRVIEPAVEAEGRGSSRRFSEMNLFEIILALELKRYNISTEFITIHLRVLERFFPKIEKELGRNSLELLRNDEIQFFLLVYNGIHINYRYYLKSSNVEKTRPGLDLSSLEDHFKKIRAKLDTDRQKTNWGRTTPLFVEFGEPNRLKLSPDYSTGRPYISKLEVNLNIIAQNTRI